MNLREICTEIEKAARETGAFILNESLAFDIERTESKGLHDFVSYVDKGSEKMLVEKLSLILPEAGFIVEEGTSSKKGERYCWVVDPLDGTTNFVHGLHPYAISIALMEDNEAVAGVVYEAGGNETFMAWKGGGAWLNGKRINVSNAQNLDSALVATGFPYNDFKRLGSYIKCLTWFLQNTHGVRRLGSAAIDLAYVACGRFEVFFEYGLSKWDVAAGILLVREAGGKVTDFSGIENRLDGEEIVASNSVIFPEVQEIISKFMMNKSVF
jgi:myo-inositol-1(or 4)-monophosphatase